MPKARGYRIIVSRTVAPDGINQHRRRKREGDWGYVPRSRKMSWESLPEIIIFQYFFLTSMKILHFSTFSN